MRRRPHPRAAELFYPSRRLLGFVLGAALLASPSCGRPAATSASDDFPLEISPAEVSLTVGDSARLFVHNANAAAYVPNSVSWSSSSASVARVSPDGWLYARGKGVATISVTNGAHSASSVVNVSRPPLTDLTIVAHRGFAKVFPENTLTAVQKAFDAGADAVEVDVAMSADLVPMIMHDETVDRTTNGTGPIRLLTSSQLRALDACSKAGSQWQPCPVPFAKEILDEAHGRGRVLLHLKGAWPATALDRLVALVHAEDMTRDATIIAFEHDWLEYLHAVHPEIVLGYLARSADPADSFLSLGDGAGLYYDSILVANPSFAAAVRQKALERGAAFGTWTIYSKVRAATLRGLGAGWLITDVPLSKDSLAAISVSRTRTGALGSPLVLLRAGPSPANAARVRGATQSAHQAAAFGPR